MLVSMCLLLVRPVQKTTFLLNRFSDDEIGGMPIQRPKQVKAIKMRGKAKALYTFKAQSNRYAYEEITSKP